mmetsp:Transcript_56783/g.122745  ORF Transcript_56783/g.122745 Transcript_56783/m.122745 type:complete len:303 (-) Transcript_56783:78-986(-)|eukprot:CAMPEP_0170617468 /NCGR_PEP_ID=MMETSP0224-20130122/26437_1 /TAXON_ID=285029 /ORGANISM="Togula jolla, Strain CCCM 725" /LENGTH=302 /DNA_ID=CAMNT_0010943369 /DNA_START=11 /DNA_END=919 /DNA_ORIENTATION=+
MAWESVSPNASTAANAESVPDASTDLSWKNWVSLTAYVLNLVLTYLSITGIFGATNSDLSKKYQTLVSPAGWAFSIWGPIFIWEGVFAVAQMFPRFRNSPMALAVAPWWWSACFFQIAWTMFFAQEIIPVSLVCMFGILGSLLGLALWTDGQEATCAEIGLLRAPFSLHLGWIIVASILNVNVQADANSAPPEQMLALAILSVVAVCVIAANFAGSVRSPDPIICLVATWAFLGIFSELQSHENLDSPTRYNPHRWDPMVLDALARAVLGGAGIAVVLALQAAVRRISPRLMKKPSGLKDTA